MQPEPADQPSDESSDETLRPFRIAVPDAVLDDLRARLRATRWPGREPVSDWSQGVPLAYLQDVCRYWAQDYDWRAREAALNRFDQFTTAIDGLDVHFLHVRSGAAHAVPLLLTHGWPGSFAEFAAVVEPLVDPPDGRDAFHVVCPSLPGFGFSGKPAEAGWGVPRIADAWAALMARLGYERFAAHGGDWGAIVTSRLGEAHPQRLLGIHLTMPLAAPEPGDADERGAHAVAALAARDHYERSGSGYAREQATKPQTLGYGLTDSPAGQAAWILEKYREWTDCAQHPEEAVARDALLDAVTIYWVTASAASSARLYWESFRRHGPEPVRVPTAVAAFPAEIIKSTPEWAARRYDLRRWTDMPRGGHFAALEQPELLVEDLRAWFRELR
ncbi:MAG: epoxide hydrolase family protein [Pseudonocardia sp.]